MHICLHIICPALHATLRVQHCEVLVVGHDWLLERCQDVLEVILRLGGDVLTQTTPGPGFTPAPCLLRPTVLLNNEVSM